MSLVVLVPCLARPQNVAPLIEAFYAATPPLYRLLWICDPGDRAQQDAIAAEGGHMISPGGTYPEKIRAGVEATTESLIVLGADDIRPHAGWLEAARTHMADGAQVVGLNDGLVRPTRPTHATHFLMTRAYAELPCIDGSPGPLYSYMHERCDDELIATATKRGVYAYAPDALVEHRHWLNGTAEDDEVYRKGRSSARLDRKTFLRRSHLWT